MSLTVSFPFYYRYKSPTSMVPLAYATRKTLYSYSGATEVSLTLETLSMIVGCKLAKSAYVTIRTPFQIS